MPRHIDGCLALAPMPNTVEAARIPVWDFTRLRHRACPVCKEDAALVICKRPDGLIVHQCSPCGMLYLADIPDSKDLSRIYQDYGQYKGYRGVATGPRPSAWWQRVLRSRDDFMLQILEAFDNLAGRRLCEIGCSYGRFLELARDRGC